MMTTQPLFIRVLQSTLIATIGAVCCSSAGCSSAEPEASPPPPALLGRYALTGQSAYAKLYFSKEHTYEAMLANCTSNCVEKGTFTHRDGTLSLESESGKRLEWTIAPTDAESRARVGTSAVKPRAVGDAVPSDSNSNDDPCADPAFGSASVSSVRPRAAGEHPAPNGPLLGATSCLLTGVVMRAKMTGSDGSEVDATLEGTKPPSQVVAAVTPCQAAWSRAALQCGSTLCSVVGCLLHRIDPEYCAGILPGLPACVTAVQNAMAVCRSPSCG